MALASASAIGRRQMRRAVQSVLGIAAVALAVSACGGSSKNTTSSAPSSAPPAAGSSSSAAPATSASTPASTAAQLPLKTEGVLTVGACVPAPGFINGKASGNTIPNPTGFEVDVANEIAKRLGIPQVKWVSVPFANLFSPAPTKFDFDINEITITAKRQQVVDFSAPYFDANQALLVHKGTPAENAKTLADVKKLHLGGQATTTGLDYIKNNIKPQSSPKEYSLTTTAIQAVKVKQIDGFVIDTPIAIAAMKQFPNDLAVVGQFITHEQYGILFQKGDALKTAVDGAIGAMKADGTLKKLQDTWFPGSTEIPTIG
jgi:polar amino acid transport system substrate-binding protein